MITKHNLIFMGPPGAGKGTVAEMIANQTDMVHVSTGDIFREQIQRKTPLGIKVENIIASGGYVSDDITNEIVKNKITELNEKNKQIILDGYPRTIQQAQFLDNMEYNSFKVIELEASDDLIIKRLTGRRICPNCKLIYHIESRPSRNGDYCEKCDFKLQSRKDDIPEAIMKRLDVYKRETAPLLDHYKLNGRVSVISANNTPEKVVSEILKLV